MRARRDGREADRERDADAGSAGSDSRTVGDDAVVRLAVRLHVLTADGHDAERRAAAREVGLGLGVKATEGQGAGLPKRAVRCALALGAASPSAWLRPRLALLGSELPM